MPPISRPVMFDTVEADAILAALQTFPPDNPWNQAVDRWPVHPDSGALVADNGQDWAISVPDERIPVLHEELHRVRGGDFEVVVPPR